MRKNKILLGLSVVANIVLGYFLFEKKKVVVKPNNTQTYISAPRELTVLSDEKVFKQIFIEKNDSVYREYFGNTFEGNPVQSFMLACTYYMIGKKQISSYDIKVVGTELKGRYGYSPEIDFKSIK